MFLRPFCQTLSPTDTVLQFLLTLINYRPTMHGMINVSSFLFWIINNIFSNISSYKFIKNIYLLINSLIYLIKKY